MSERLPQPNIIIPAERETLRLMLVDQRIEWLGALPGIRRGSHDAGRQDRQARANLNHLLDHFPNGVPRDHLVEQSPPATPEGVVLGVE